MITLQQAERAPSRRLREWRIWIVTLLSIGLAPVAFSLQTGEMLLLRLFVDGPRPPSYENAIPLTALLVLALGPFLLPTLRSAVSRRDPLVLATLTLSAIFLTLGTSTAMATGHPYPLLPAIQYVGPLAALVIGLLFQERYRVEWFLVLTTYILVNLGICLAVYLRLAAQREGLSPFHVIQVARQYLHGVSSHLPACILLASLLLPCLAARRRMHALIVGALGTLAVAFATPSRTVLVVAITALGFTTLVATRRLVARPDAANATALLLSLGLLAGTIVLPQGGVIRLRASTPDATRTSEALPDRLRSTPDRYRREATSAAPSPSGAPHFEPEPVRPEGKASDRVRVESAGDRELPGPRVAPEVSKENPKDGTMESLSSLESSNRSRIEFMREGLARWAESPIFGVAFRPDDQHVIHRRVVEKKQVFQAHNQYIDVLLKSGLVGLLGGLVLAWLLLREIVPACRLPPGGRLYDYPVVLAVLAGVAIGANFQLYLSVWTTAIPLGFLVGAVVSAARSDALRATAAGASTENLPLPADPGRRKGALSGGRPRCRVPPGSDLHRGEGSGNLLPGRSACMGGRDSGAAGNRLSRPSAPQVPVQYLVEIPERPLSADQLPKLPHVFTQVGNQSLDGPRGRRVRPARSGLQEQVPDSGP